MPSTVLWFRRDLRLTDLPSLLDAAADGAKVLGCFVLDPRLEASSGPRRLQFLGDCLRELEAALDGRLLITRGRPEQVIPRIAAAIEASSVHVSADFSPFGMRRDRAVAEALAADHVQWAVTGSPYLVSPGRVTKDDGSPYKVFTPFFARWREVGWRAPAQSAARPCHGWTRRPSPACPSASRPPIPVLPLTLRPANRLPGNGGRSSSPTGSPSTPRTATGPTGPAPAGCRRT